MRLKEHLEENITVKGFGGKQQWEMEIKKHSVVEKLIIITVKGGGYGRVMVPIKDVPEIIKLLKRAK